MGHIILYIDILHSMKWDLGVLVFLCYIYYIILPNQPFFFLILLILFPFKPISTTPVILFIFILEKYLFLEFLLLIPVLMVIIYLILPFQFRSHFHSGFHFVWIFPDFIIIWVHFFKIFLGHLHLLRKNFNLPFS